MQYHIGLDHLCVHIFFHGPVCNGLDFILGCISENQWSVTGRPVFVVLILVSNNEQLLLWGQCNINFLPTSQEHTPQYTNFFLSAIRLWNNFPPEISAADSPTACKAAVEDWMRPTWYSIYFLIIFKNLILAAQHLHLFMLLLLKLTFVHSLCQKESLCGAHLLVVGMLF